MENIPLFKLNPADYSLVDNASAAENPLRHMSMKQCANLLRDYQSSLHFSNPRNDAQYPCIASGLGSHYDGLMTVAVGYGSAQPRRLISGVGDLSEIFEAGAFVTPPRSQGRNWLSVLPALAPFSDLILYSQSKDAAELLQAASDLAKTQHDLFVTGKSGRLYRTFILQDFSVQQFETEYPDLVVYALDTDDREKYQHRIMANRETDQGFFVKAPSSEIIPGVWLGTLHSFQEEQKLSRYSLYVECVSKDENLVTFPEGALQPVWLPKNIETFGEMLQYLVDSVTSVMLFRVDESDLGSPKFAEWMTVFSIFINTRAANGEHTLIFCKTGHITAPCIALATILQSMSVEDLNANASIPLIGHALVQLQKVRPCYLAKPYFGNVARLLAKHLTGRPDTYFSDSINVGGFLPGLPSFIIPNLFLGNLEHFEDAKVLQALGIKTVVSICSCGNSDLTNINHIRINHVMDDSRSSLYHSFEEITSIMHECLESSQGGGGGVLVHCQAGVSRSATIVIAYLMRYKNMSLRDAFLYVRHRRLSVFVQPNVQFMYDLLEFELKLRGKRSVAWLDLMKELHILNTVARAKSLLV